MIDFGDRVPDPGRIDYWRRERGAGDVFAGLGIPSPSTAARRCRQNPQVAGESMGRRRRSGGSWNAACAMSRSAPAAGRAIRWNAYAVAATLGYLAAVIWFAFFAGSPCSGRSGTGGERSPRCRRTAAGRPRPPRVAEGRHVAESSSPEAMSRRSRRMIFPERVLGRSSAPDDLFRAGQLADLLGDVVAQLGRHSRPAVPPSSGDEGDDRLTGVSSGCRSPRPRRPSGGRRAPTRPPSSRACGPETLITSSMRPTIQK